MWLRTRLTLDNLLVEPAPSYYTIVLALIVVCSPLRFALTAHSVLHTQQFTQLELVDNSNFDSYAARDGCTTVGTTTVSTLTSTSQSVSSSTATQTSTTAGCGYDDPTVNKKGANAFRIDILEPASLSQCQAACTANVDCNGVSYNAGDNVRFSLVVAQPFRRTLLLIHYTRM